MGARFGERGVHGRGRAPRATVALLALVGLGLEVGVFYWLGVAAVAALLAVRALARPPDDLRRLDAAFFTVNGVISVVFLASWPARRWPRAPTPADGPFCARSPRAAVLGRPGGRERRVAALGAARRRRLGRRSGGAEPSVEPARGSRRGSGRADVVLDAPIQLGVDGASRWSRTALVVARDPRRAGAVGERASRRALDLARPPSWGGRLRNPGDGGRGPRADDAVQGRVIDSTRPPRRGARSRAGAQPEPPFRAETQPRRPSAADGERLPAVRCETGESPRPDGAACRRSSGRASRATSLRCEGRGPRAARRRDRSSRQAAVARCSGSSPRPLDRRALRSPPGAASWARRLVRRLERLGAQPASLRRDRSAAVVALPPPASLDWPRDPGAGCREALRRSACAWRRPRPRPRRLSCSSPARTARARRRSSGSSPGLPPDGRRARGRGRPRRGSGTSGTSRSSTAS